ncbi:MAG TPA: four helix bundle protein [Polyangiaceae bacterium]
MPRSAGSTSELDYQLLLARDLGHLPSDAHAHLAEEVSEVRRMLYPFIQSLNAESG